jgi:hypothetical protein
MASWDDVRAIALALPDTSERPMHGQASWRVRDKLFVWERPLRKSDLRAIGDAAPPPGPIVGARVEHVLAREVLIESDPATFFTIPHFDGYAAVLALLDVITVPDLEELITEAWLCRAPPKLAQQYIDTRLRPGPARQE